MNDANDEEQRICAQRKNRISKKYAHNTEKNNNLWRIYACNAAVELYIFGCFMRFDCQT